MIYGLFLCAKSEDLEIHNKVSENANIAENTLPQELKQGHKNKKQRNRRKKKKKNKLKEAKKKQPGSSKNIKQKDKKPEDVEKKPEDVEKKPEETKKGKRNRRKKKKKNKLKEENKQSSLYPQVIIRDFPGRFAGDFLPQDDDLPPLVPMCYTNITETERFLKDTNLKDLFEKIREALSREINSIPNSSSGNELFGKPEQRMIAQGKSLKKIYGDPFKDKNLVFQEINLIVNTIHGDRSPQEVMENPEETGRGLRTWKLNDDSIEKLDRHFSEIVASILSKSGIKIDVGEIRDMFSKNMVIDAILLSCLEGGDRLLHILKSFCDHEESRKMVLKINEGETLTCSVADPQKLDWASSPYFFSLLILLDDMMKAIAENNTTFEMIDAAIDYKIITTDANKKWVFLNIFRLFIFDSILKHLILVN
jgi:hypothetical protein